MKLYNFTLIFVGLIALGFLINREYKASQFVVTTFGSNYITHNGPYQTLNDAITDIFHEIGYTEIDENGKRSQNHNHNSASTRTVNGKNEVSQISAQTKDKDGVFYKYTSITLGDRDPIVILESTCEDPNQFMNLIVAKLKSSDVTVKRYNQPGYIPPTYNLKFNKRPHPSMIPTPPSPPARPIMPTQTNSK